MKSTTDHPLFKLVGKKVTGLKTSNFDGSKCEGLEIMFSGGSVVINAEWDEGWRPFLVAVEAKSQRKKAS